MKRVINGVTYNTDTARIVARWKYTDRYERQATLYQTRGGAFFAVHLWTTVDEELKVYFETGESREGMSPAEILLLVAKEKDLTIINEEFVGALPEAEPGDVAGATLYIRLPTSLKTEIVAAAGSEKLSINAWAMRAMESGLASREADRDRLPSIPRPA